MFSYDDKNVDFLSCPDFKGDILQKVVTLFAFLRHPNFEGIQVILLERLCRGNKRLGFKRA